MSPDSADPDWIATIRRLADTELFAHISKQARLDMMAHNLKQGDVADAIIELIDAGDRGKPTVIHSIPDRIGDPAYEMKAMLNDVMWYFKVAIDNRGRSNESLALLSAHPDHRA